VRFSEITDGLSNTILGGEKHVPQGTFGVGYLDASTWNGDNLVSCTRSGGNGIGIAHSLKDPGWKFGSYHNGVCQFVFADGSVQVLPSAISPDTLGLLLDINDGEVIPPY
jgi:prepilin-type processing-associated H-X9-DG protein